MNDRIAELRRRVVGEFDDEARSEVVMPVSPRVIDLSDLLSRPDEPIPWAVPGWLAQGGTAILGGEPKLGKTTVAHDLMFAMATGMPWPSISIWPLRCTTRVCPPGRARSTCRRRYRRR